jgi:hypothetical protein
MFPICSQCQQKVCSVPGASCCKDCSNFNGWLYVQSQNPELPLGRIDTSKMNLAPSDVDDKEKWKKYFNSNTDNFLYDKPIIHRKY